MRRLRTVAGEMAFAVLVAALLATLALMAGRQGGSDSNQQVNLKAPAGTLPASREVNLGTFKGAVLPNGRFITPVGIELSARAPKPYGMALSPDGNTLATVNSGVGPFSITLLKNI